jgi:hypothetical protein
MHHNPPPAVGRHGGTIHQNSREASVKGCCVAPEKFGCKITHLPSCLHSIHPQQHGFNTSQSGVQKRTPTALWPAVWDTPWQWTTHNRSCSKFSEPSIWHPQLCPLTPEAGQWSDENLVRPLGLLCGLPGGWQSVVLSPNPQEGEVTHAPILMRGPIQDSRLDKWCGIQDSAEP